VSDIQDELDRLERDDPDVRAASASLDAVVDYLDGRLPSPIVKAIYDLSAEVHAASGLTQKDFTLLPPPV
jgi:hypothetical protein